MAEEAQAVEQNPLHDLVQHALDQDFNKANKVFNDVIQVKLNDVLDAEKIKLSNQIYNGIEPGDQEEDDEEQLELDLDTEEGEGETDLSADSESEDEASEEESDTDVEEPMGDDELSDEGSDDGEDEDGDDEETN